MESSRTTARLALQRGHRPTRGEKGKPSQADYSIVPLGRIAPGRASAVVTLSRRRLAWRPEKTVKGRGRSGGGFLSVALPSHRTSWSSTKRCGSFTPLPERFKNTSMRLSVSGASMVSLKCQLASVGFADGGFLWLQWRFYALKEGSNTDV